MTQTQLIDRFLEGVTPGTYITSGLMGATNNRLRWRIVGKEFGRTLAFRNNGAVLVMLSNEPRSCRKYSMDRERYLLDRCAALGIRWGRATKVDRLPGPPEMGVTELMLRYLGLTKKDPPEPLNLHMSFGKLLKYTSMKDRWWDSYTVACTIAGVEPLFQSAPELENWYAAASLL